MIQHTDDISALIKALHKVQGGIHGVVKDSKNPHFKTKYASLEAVIETARPALQSAGITFTQAAGAIVDGSIEITTMLMHDSGQWMRSTLHVPLAKRDPQGVGSAITYGCRYSLMAALGLPPVDDDAESATDRTAKPTDAPQFAKAVEKYGSTTYQSDWSKAALAKIDRAQTTRELREWWDANISERAALGLAAGTPAYDSVREYFIARGKHLSAHEQTTGKAA